MTEVELWLIPTDQPPDICAELAALLDPQERDRARRTADPRRRRRFVVAHGAARLLAGVRCGRPPAALRWQRGPHGKPELPGPVGVSLSTAGGFALFATVEQRAVGVDLEPVPAEPTALRLAERYFPADEAAWVAGHRAAERFTRQWTRKEAVVKALGGRLADGLRHPLLGPPRLLTETAGGPCQVLDLTGPPGHRAAVALLGAAPFTVHQRVWCPDPTVNSSPLVEP
ncbi:4'-phosphopantetheinyl transferase family protein [Streptomyces tateyamensis]|uniref:4'-phosphopantetheinyl transferase family protein n=1 Tax=Streptomyces tateyamensis TaxID=565073 RepID=UPI0015E880E9|nr:4'-phosphopantetheinyl transferase superfamily protein [Streptomyces tateyamensis]